MDLYLLPGLAADRRLFARMHFPGHTVHYLDHPVMPPRSTLSDYAHAHMHAVDRSRKHALIGVSMGGMIAQELALLTAPHKTVLVSSWKGPQEMPPAIKLLRGTHPERVLTKAFMQRTLPFVKWQMGIEGPEDAALFADLLERYTTEQMKIQLNACLTWNGPSRAPGPLLHIHGDADRLMPLVHIKDPVVIKGGGHFMVYNKAEEVRAAIDLR